MEIPKGWTEQENKLVKKFVFADFKTCLAIMMKIGFEAEYLNHHPEWTNVYNRLEIKLTTHDQGGIITEKDIQLAERINQITQQ